MANDKALAMLKEKLAYPKDNVHPITKSDIEFKNYYLNALAVLLKIDSETHDLEKKYILKLITIFGLPDNKLDEMLEFGENPDHEIMKEYVDFFKNKDEKYNLIIDCLIISKIDNELSASEKDFIDTLSNIFNIEENEKNIIANLALIVQNLDVEKAFNLLFENMEMFVKFKSILIAYGIDIVKHYNELKNILDFQTEKWEWGYSSYNDDFPVCYLPSTKPVSNEQFVKFLNYIIDKYGLAQTIKDDTSLDKSIIEDSTGVLYLDLNASDIKFKNNKFIVDYASKTKYIKGIHTSVVQNYSEYVSKILSCHIIYLSFRDMPIDMFGGVDYRFKIPSFLDVNAFTNDENLDEIVFFRNEFFLINRGCNKDYNYNSFRSLRFYEAHTAIYAENFSNNLTFRVMKKAK